MSTTYYRVAEINPAYDLIPSTGENADDIWLPDKDGVLVPWRKGPGWIYFTNEINTYSKAIRESYIHRIKTGFETRIDTFEKPALLP